MSLINTVIQSQRGNYDPNGADRYEHLDSDLGFLRLASENRGIPQSIVSETNKKKIMSTPWNIGVQIPVFNQGGVTVSNAVTCALPSHENTSALMAITYFTLSFGFSQIVEEFAGNEISKMDDMARKMDDATRSAAESIEASILTAIEATKNQVWGGISPEYYTEAGDELLIPATDEDTYNNLSAIMRQLKFKGQHDIVSTHKESTFVNKWANQGNANSVNKAWEVAPYNFLDSHFITNTVGNQSTGYIVPRGSVVLLNRNAPAPIQGGVKGVKYGTKTYSLSPTLPKLGLQFGMMHDAECADNSAVGGSASTAGPREAWTFYSQLAIVTRYNSDPANIASPYVKFGRLS